MKKQVLISNLKKRLNSYKQQDLKKDVIIKIYL